MTARMDGGAIDEPFTFTIRGRIEARDQDEALGRLMRVLKIVGFEDLGGELWLDRPKGGFDDLGMAIGDWNTHIEGVLIDEPKEEV